MCDKKAHWQVGADRRIATQRSKNNLAKEDLERKEREEKFLAEVWKWKTFLRIKFSLK